jgi:hypothetical protein
MDFSSGWEKRDPVRATERLAKAMLELARTAMPQATLRPAVGSRPVLERPEPDSQRRLRLLGPPA